MLNDGQFFSVLHLLLLFVKQNSELSEYKSKVGELRSENDYQLRLKDMNYGEKIREMKDNHSHEMEQLRTQYEVCMTSSSVVAPPTTQP